MICSCCGKEIADSAKFCPSCGGAQQPAAPAEIAAPAEVIVPAEVITTESAPVPQEPVPNPQEPLRLDKPAKGIGQRLWGLLFLLAALAAGFTPRWMNSLYSFDMEELYALGKAYVSTIPVFVSLLNLLNTFAFMMAALVSLAAGMALLMGCSGARKAAISAIVFQGITLVHIITMLVICRAIPAPVMQLLNYPQAYIKDAASFIRREHDLSNRYLYALLTQGAVFALLIFTATRLRIRGQKLDRGITGLLITLPFLAFVITHSGNLDSGFINMYGSTQVLAYTAAVGAVYDEIPQETLWIWIALILTVGLLLRKQKFSILALGMGAVVLVGTVFLMLQVDTEGAVETYENLDLEDLEDWVLRFVDMKLIGGGAIMLALGLWVAATAKGAIPLWVQLPVSILLFMLLYTLHYVSAMVLHLPVWLPVGKITTALILVAIAVPLGIRADKKMLSSQKI